MTANQPQRTFVNKINGNFKQYSNQGKIIESPSTKAHSSKVFSNKSRFVGSYKSKKNENYGQKSFDEFRQFQQSSKKRQSGDGCGKNGGYYYYEDDDDDDIRFDNSLKNDNTMFYKSSINKNQHNRKKIASRPFYYNQFSNNSAYHIPNYNNNHSKYSFEYRLPFTNSHHHIVHKQGIVNANSYPVDNRINNTNYNSNNHFRRFRKFNSSNHPMGYNQNNSYHFEQSRYNLSHIQSRERSRDASCGSTDTLPIECIVKQPVKSALKRQKHTTSTDSCEKVIPHQPKKRIRNNSESNVLDIQMRNRFQPMRRSRSAVILRHNEGNYKRFRRSVTFSEDVRDNSDNSFTTDSSMFDTRCSIFVGSIPLAVSRCILLDVFSKHGVIDRCVLKYGGWQQYAFIKYARPESAAKAIRQENAKRLYGSHLHVEYVKNLTNDYHTFTHRIPPTGLFTFYCCGGFRQHYSSCKWFKIERTPSITPNMLVGSQTNSSNFFNKQSLYHKMSKRTNSTMQSDPTSSFDSSRISSFDSKLSSFDSSRVSSFDSRISSVDSKTRNTSIDYSSVDDNPVVIAVKAT